MKIIFAAILGVILLSTSCEDDEHVLGRMLGKSEIDFEVSQDLATDPGGNTVILKNNTPGTISIWDYGTGRSNRQQDTVRFAFQGSYEIKFSAVTAGGIVEMDPVIIEVTADNLNYVNDPFWTALSGGVGNEKTWLLDLDANGVSKFFNGPIYFSGDALTWDKACVVEGPTCWIWEADWAGNPWIGDAGDYGTMTFNLKGGPFVTVDHKMIPAKGVQSGTYFLDANARTLAMTDAEVLQNSWAVNDVESFTTGYFISLTEDAMQIAYPHKTKEEFMIFNYISKEYSDNWVPEEVPDPDFDHGDQGEILAVTSTKTWKFDLEVPYNWTNLQGDFLNPWTSRADIIATGWAPYGDGDVQNIDGVSISFSADGSVTITQDDGTSASGTFAIDEPTNTVSFSGVTPNILIASWVSATTTDQNTWKIVKVERDDLTDAVTGIWFGKRDPLKDEYMVFHFVLG